MQLQRQEVPQVGTPAVLEEILVEELPQEIVKALGDVNHESN
jgi:hypothetical protein